MKPPSEKQVKFARSISSLINKPLPEEYTAQAYFLYIQDNLPDYQEKQIEINRRWRKIVAKERRERRRYSYVDEEQDADWAAAMDFSWM